MPIPGAQQHKRPRRRYEEIERMYKCGWNGCEKAYGTLNHLNAHVTMQSHGSKRTPEGKFLIVTVNVARKLYIKMLYQRAGANLGFVVVVWLSKSARALATSRIHAQT